MHLRRRAFGRKAVSPLLATIILIAITVAAGLVIYNVFFSTAGTMSQQLNVQPTSVDIVKAGTITLVSATIKNTGNKPITSCNVTVWGDSGTATLSLGALDVGQSKSTSTTNPSDFSVTVGKAYPVKVDAAASDGSTFSKSFTVTCTG
jgi:flagellin-like protein